MTAAAGAHSARWRFVGRDHPCRWLFVRRMLYRILQRLTRPHAAVVACCGAFAHLCRVWFQAILRCKLVVQSCAILCNLVQKSRHRAVSCCTVLAQCRAIFRRLQRRALHDAAELKGMAEVRNYRCSLSPSLSSLVCACRQAFSMHMAASLVVALTPAAPADAPPTAS